MPFRVTGMHHNTRLLIGGALGFLLLCGAYSIFVYMPLSGVGAEGVRMQIGEETISVTIADDEAERSQGLSGHPGLERNEGMLFVFGTSGIYSFWMKDMNFPIDIIWISESEVIVEIAGSVSPDTYPQTFSSKAPAKYVLELPAGWVAAHGVRVGDRVVVPRS